MQAREVGKSVLLVDGPGDLAGLCILRGCMPAKTVLHAADVAHEAEVAPGLGVETKNVRIDPQAIVARTHHLVDEFKTDRLEGIGSFPLYRGSPVFVGERELDVDGQRIVAERFLVATGSTIEPPAIEGLTASGYFTSDQALEMTEVPHRILAIGGGPVGCEFAQYFARLGAEVTLVQDAPALLRSEDTDVGNAIADALTEEHVRVMVDARVERIERSGEQRIVTVCRDGETERIAVDGVFLTTGRRPNVEGFGLDRAGVAYDRTGIRHDVYLQTTNPAIYAAGDVLGRRCQVHTAEYGGRLAAKNAFCGERVVMNFDLFDVHSVYTQPEVAVAGLNERTLRARGIAYEAAQYPFHDHGKALTMNLPQGFVKVLAASDGTILGVTFVCDGAVDLIHEASALLYCRAKVTDVLNMPHLHPTMGEIITYPCEEIAKRLSLEREIVYY